MVAWKPRRHWTQPLGGVERLETYEAEAYQLLACAAAYIHTRYTPGLPTQATAECFVLPKPTTDAQACRQSLRQAVAAVASPSADLGSGSSSAVPRGMASSSSSVKQQERSGVLLPIPQLQSSQHNASAQSLSTMGTDYAFPAESSTSSSSSSTVSQASSVDASPIHTPAPASSRASSPMVGQVNSYGVINFVPMIAVPTPSSHATPSAQSCTLPSGPFFRGCTPTLPLRPAQTVQSIAASHNSTQAALNSSSQPSHDHRTIAKPNITDGKLTASECLITETARQHTVLCTLPASTAAAAVHKRIPPTSPTLLTDLPPVLLSKIASHTHSIHDSVALASCCRYSHTHLSTPQLQACMLWEGDSATALVFAALLGWLDTLSVLLCNHPTSLHTQGFLALFNSVIANQPGAVELLLNAGAGSASLPSRQQIEHYTARFRLQGLDVATQAAQCRSHDAFLQLMLLRGSPAATQVLLSHPGVVSDALVTHLVDLLVRQRNSGPLVGLLQARPDLDLVRVIPYAAMAGDVQVFGLLLQHVRAQYVQQSGSAMSWQQRYEYVLAMYMAEDIAHMLGLGGIHSMLVGQVER